MPKSRSLTSPLFVTRTLDGLQVAMHDEVAVRRRDRVAAVLQELEARLDGETPRPAVLRDRLALDELHHEVRPPVLGRAAVEEPRDVRVLEAREDAPLAGEAREDFVRRHAASQELDRDALVEEAVGALGEEDLAHAAAPEPAEHAVGTDALRRRSFVRDPGSPSKRLPATATAGVSRKRPASESAARSLRTRSERSRSASAARRPRRSDGESSTSSSKSDRTSVQRRPSRSLTTGFTVVDDPVTSPSPSKAPGRNARAACQWRLTVRSDRPDISAISSTESRRRTATRRAARARRRLPRACRALRRARRSPRRAPRPVSRRSRDPGAAGPSRGAGESASAPDRRGSSASLVRRAKRSASDPSPSSRRRARA